MHTVGIIGYGTMGAAIAQRIKSAYAVTIFDKETAKLQGVSGIRVAATLDDLVKNVAIVVLAVKPQDFDPVLKAIARLVQDKYIVSIAAGITIGHIEKMLPGSMVVRVMPNIAAKIGEAESVLCKGSLVSDSDLAMVRGLFDAVGRTWIMPEEMLDAATAISGSGPAYIYFDMEKNGIAPESITNEKIQEYERRFVEAAKRVGIGEDAMSLAQATTSSAIHLAQITGTPVAQLRAQVTSKGGTTEAALKVLSEGGTWVEAAAAAKKRAGELSKK